MRIVEAWDDPAAMQVNHASGRARKLPHLLRGADTQDAIAIHRDPFSLRLRRIFRPDVPVNQHERCIDLSTSGGCTNQHG